MIGKCRSDSHLKPQQLRLGVLGISVLRFPLFFGYLGTNQSTWLFIFSISPRVLFVIAHKKSEIKDLAFVIYQAQRARRF